MCGLAGYNVSPEWVSNYFTQEVQQELLRQAWLRNLHRGKDAAGFFALNQETDKIRVFKAAGQADDIIEKSLEKARLQPTRVLGAHTRAKTRGDTSDPKNNHPVFYKDIWVTHNGTIQNDREIKKYLLADEDQFGEVDSVAIPMVLSEVSEPYDLDGITDELCTLWGSFAIHAVWKNQPGLSLLARGTGSPLTLGYHPAHGGAVVYGSEIETVWALIDAMGLNPKDKNWNYHDLDDHKAVQVENGTPINWADFSHSPYSRNTTPYFLYRMLPKRGKKEVDVVYFTDSVNDFAVKHGEMGRDITKVSEEKQEEVYSFNEGFTDPKKEFPMLTDIAFFSVFSEADKIIKNKHSDKYHIFYGDIEIISNDRTVIDVYDHSKLSMSQRWIVEKKTADVKKETKGNNFYEFLKENSSEIKKQPFVDEKFRYEWTQNQASVYRLPLPGDRRRGNDAAPLVMTGGNGKKKNVGEAKPPRSRIMKGNLINPPVMITEENFADEITEHVKYHDFPDMAFFTRGGVRKCRKHNDVLLTEHPDPYNCGICKAETVHVLSACGSVEMVHFLLPGTVLKMSSGNDNKCKKEDHDWIDARMAEVLLENHDYLEFLIQQDCTICSSIWTVTGLPDWLNTIVHQRREVFVTYAN